MTEVTATATSGDTSTAYTMIDARGLQKRYPGEAHPALEDFTLTIPQGCIFGLIGANGAGKSSVLRILATLVKPDKGDAYVAGYSVRRYPQEVRRLIGYMPDEYGLYKDMRVGEYLDFFAACYGINGKRRTRLVSELLELVDLQNYRNDELRDLSRGMRQRLILAHTLVHDPKVLLLDEPASGLDPRARVELRELLRELSQMGKTIVLSSHVLSEVQMMCDRLGIMALGRLISYGPTDVVVNQIEHQPRRSVTLRVLSLAELKRAASVAETFPKIIKGSLRIDEKTLCLDALIEGDDRTSASFLTYMSLSGIFVTQYGQSTARLEELFLRD
ncbi:MAG TPA: ABC transporter ATP-binding protein [Chloroflexia bacterium]|nr:ABC transporter ATP-binding protein [Chloroflexia bacterium]